MRISLLLDILFDGSSYLKFLYKYYLVCFDLFYTSIIIYLFYYLYKTLNKTTDQLWGHYKTPS
jgi:hypothetical protein